MVVSMTVKELMKIGCEGMSADQLREEQQRRLKVSQKINEIGETYKTFYIGYLAYKDQKGSPVLKKINAKLRQLERALNKIKSDESIWLKEAAWFLY